MIRTIAALPILALLLVPGCAIQSHTDFDPQTDFSKYRTFSLAPAPEKKPKGLVGYSAITARRIQENIGTALESKGYRQVSASKADMMVAFTVSGEPRVDIVGYGPGWYGDTYTQHYVQGSLVINIYDTRSKQLIWHGWATAEIFDSNAARKAEPEAVQAILKKFPPS